MIRTILFLALIALTLPGYSQSKNKQSGKEILIPMEAAYWDFDESQVLFTQHRSVPAVKGKTDQGLSILLKDHLFKNGTIEFDVELLGFGFPGIHFRSSKDQKESELFYLRYFGKPDPVSRQAVQYAAIIDEVNLWDISDEFQSNADIREGQWNHIKLVVSGKQLKAYVNDMSQPALSVPCMEGALDQGLIALRGNVIFSNLKLYPDRTENLPEVAGYDATANDSNYLRNWKVSPAHPLPYGTDIFTGIPNQLGAIINPALLDSTTLWKALPAERRALVNLTRLYGKTPAGDRRLCFIKTTITSTKDQVRKLHLGFSDEVWVFINDATLLTDKNYYGSPSMKYPRGRCTIDNTSVEVPLQAGENVLLIGVANFFFGWGIIARLDDTEGLTF